MRVDGSIETTWKHYMMFSRTSLLMHSERVYIEGSSSSGSSSSSSGSSDSIPSAQDKGCLVEVVRTGFERSQVRYDDDDGDDDDDDDDDNDATVVDGEGGGGGGASMRVDGSIETTWKHYMMFSRTSLLMHSERVDIEGSSSSSSGSSDSIPSAKDKGCLVEVVRTGFGTSSQVRRVDDADDDSHGDDVKMKMMMMM